MVVIELSRRLKVKHLIREYNSDSGTIVDESEILLWQQLAADVDRIVISEWTGIRPEMLAKCPTPNRPSRAKSLRQAQAEIRR